MNKFLIATLAFGIVFSVIPSDAQNINSIETRLDRMEREMRTLSRSVYKGDVPPPAMENHADKQAIATSELRVNQLEDQLRRLTGMIEENTYRNRKLEEKIDALQMTPAVITTNDLPAVINDNPSSLTVDNKPYQLGTITNKNADTPAGLYDQAFSRLQAKDYASAQAGFENFISTYPSHSLAANSKYWLGETFYAREEYQSASRAFARSFKDHPEGQKAPDTLLKLAMSLKSQNMSEEACLTLGELKNRFPNAPASVMSKATSEEQSYGCSQ